MIIYSCWWKVRWNFVIHEIFLQKNRVAALFCTTESHGENNKKMWKEVIYTFWDGGGRNPSELGAPAQQVSSWDLGSSGDLCRTSCMEPFLLCFFKFPEQVSIYFTCLRECCNSVLLWSSRNVFSTPKLPPAFHQHEGEWIMTECSFLGELFL